MILEFVGVFDGLDVFGFFDNVYYGCIVMDIRVDFVMFVVRDIFIYCVELYVVLNFC